MQQTYVNLLVERHNDGVAIVTFNRPEKLNALDQETRYALCAALRDLQDDHGTRAIVLTGAGGQAFAAGQDLSEAQEFDFERVATWIDEWSMVYDTIISLHKPTIAAINGYAVGAAFQIALTCDLRIAAANARFGMPEIDDAIPCITGAWTLYEIVGRARTADMILTGRLIDAQEALNWGIINRVVPTEELLDTALDQARQLAAKSQLALRLNKERLRQLLMRDYEDTESFAKSAHGEAYGSGEPQRAMEDFLAKRHQGRSS